MAVLKKICFLFICGFLLRGNAVQGELRFPFRDFADPRSYSELLQRKGDGFGAYRKYGHLHAGLDIFASPGEAVFPLCGGKVVCLWYPFPHKAVVLHHHVAGREDFYASYVHMGEIYVTSGDLVEAGTPLGRVFTEKERVLAGFRKIHLHLEIRKTLEDEGKASYSCKSREELEKYFYDPLVFLKGNMLH